MLPGHVGGFSRRLPPPSPLPPPVRAHLSLLRLLLPPAGQSALSPLRRSPVWTLRPAPPPRGRVPREVSGPVVCHIVGACRWSPTRPGCSLCLAGGCLLAQPPLRGHERQTLLPFLPCASAFPVPSPASLLLLFALCTQDTPDVLVPSHGFGHTPKSTATAPGDPGAVSKPRLQSVCLLPQALKRT